MSTIIAGNRTLDDHLEAYGWQPGPSQQWALDTEQGRAVLQRAGVCGDWQQFTIKGGAVRKSSTARVFVDNDRLYGPAKYVARAKSSPVCRLDLPGEFSSLGREAHGRLESLSTVDPLQSWAEAVTACATGRAEGLVAPSPPDGRLVEQLSDAGWSSSLDDGRLQVHVHMPGLFRQVLVERVDDPPGVKVACELMSLEGVRGPWHKAAVRLAHAVNARLPLVRLAITEDVEPGVLRAEAHVGCAPIPGGWLPTALEVVETAVLLVARELRALRDRELAELVLAADAAGPGSASRRVS